LPRSMAFVSLCYILLLSELLDHHRALHSFPTRRSSDLAGVQPEQADCVGHGKFEEIAGADERRGAGHAIRFARSLVHDIADREEDRKSTRLNSSHVKISYAVFCLKKKTKYMYIAFVSRT